MNRIYNILLIVFVLSIYAVEASASESFIVLDSTDVQTMLKNIEYIENNGGNITHRFPPNILIGDIPIDKINGLKGKMNIKDINTDIVDNSTLTDKKKKVVADVWNNVYKHLDKDKKDTKIKGKPKPIVDDAKFINKTDKAVTIKPYSSAGNMPPYGAGFYDTSEYMIGDVAVGIILPESNGAIDPNSEDWTFNEESNVLSGIVRGLNWWASQKPGARLTFTYDINLDVPTNYEPITHPQYDQGLWINDAMKNIGFSQFGTNYFDNIYDYNNRLRESMGTDWAFTMFVVDSSNDADGQFSNGYFAYAYIGGPFNVLTYDNDGWGISNMDRVSAHETGHIFYALDEYTGVTGYSGYLNAMNVIYSGCIMDSNGWCVSSGTALELGWRDNTANNIFDIIDFKPYSQWGNIGTGNTPTITGTSYSTATYPNNNPYGYGHDITINKIIGVQYRIDNGNWQNAQPSDGLFDDSIEGFTFTTIPLLDGYHTVDVRSRDTAGIWESPYITKNIYISPVSILVVSPNGGEIWQSGSTKTVKWSYTGNPGSTVNLDLLKNGVLVKTIASGISIGSSGSGTYSWKMDTSRTPGTDYKIRVTSTSNSAYTDTSDNNFTITGPIIVTSPNGGENWRRGTSHTITWSKAGSSGSYVKIELLRSGSVVKTITSSTSNDGSYSWSISSTQTSASDYQIRITSTSNSAYKDTSDNYFTIST